MAWNNAPWAIDGATSRSSLARTEAAAATNRQEGVVSVNDWKVIPLSTPGAGFNVIQGSGFVRNYSQGTDPTQTYTCLNYGNDTVTDSRVPTTNSSARSHLIVTSVGDPEYPTVGHPWLQSTDPPSGQAATFQYVRTWVIQNVPPTTTKFTDLGLSYPAYELARYDQPANSTTITAGMLTDLRQIARPRTQTVEWNVPAAVSDPINVNPVLSWEQWPDNGIHTVAVPLWASYVSMTGFIEGWRISGAAIAQFRIAGYNTSIVSQVTHVQDTPYGTTGAERRGSNIGGRSYIPAQYRGTNVQFMMQGTVENTASNNKISTDAWTTCQVKLTFLEVAD